MTDMGKTEIRVRKELVASAPDERTRARGNGHAH